MKKVLLCLFCATMTLAASAAFQYEVLVSPSGPSGSEFIVNVKEGTGNFFLADNYATLVAGQHWISEIVDMSDKANYGFIINGKKYNAYDVPLGNLVEGEVVNPQDIDAKTILSTAARYYSLGTFSAGDSFGIWFDNQAGVKAASVGSEYNSADLTYRSYGYNSDGLQLSQFNFDSAGNLYFGIAASPAGSSGQPLPGVLFSLIFGGAAIGVSRLKKH